MSCLTMCYLKLSIIYLSYINMTTHVILLYILLSFLEVKSMNYYISLCMTFHVCSQLNIIKIMLVAGMNFNHVTFFYHLLL